MTTSSITTLASTSTVTINSRTFDHHTASTRWGGPASRFQRVERPTRSRARQPNYAARRLGVVLAAVIAAVTLLSAFDAVLGSFGSSPAYAEAETVGAEAPAAYVARSGDSLWTIADEHRGDVDRDRYVRALIDLNGSTTIFVGQAVALP